VALWETAPYAFVQPPGAPQPIPQATAAYQPVHDLLSLLLGALAERGTPYEAVAVNRNFTSADLGFAVPVSEAEAVQFTDRDVILVRADARRRLAITGTDGGAFDARFRAQVLGIPLEVDRGWVSVDVSLRGRPFRLFNTHLEAYGTSPLRDEVRNLQAVELAARVTASPHPTVVVGDINARPTMCQSWRQPPQPQDANVVAYATLAEAGLREVWPLTHRHRPCSPQGWTSGQADLFGPDTRTHRIDHIFVDDSFWALRSTVVGDERRERSRPSGAWPSDHAAAVADLVLLATPTRGSDPR
jgi:endonuclease/exonuclease/phosphatase family metal-dependent hydrolase